MKLSPAAAWAVLCVAGCLEAAWAVGLKYADGFTRPRATAFTVAAIVASMALLGWAQRTLPIGSAYPTWVGIGAVGAALAGVALFKEPATAARFFFLGLIVAGVIGLKVTTPDA
ncbi:MAG TPA: SMR family transporter [Planctomycetota bacterium]|nr:SMR family transporter [Planctomycetota bacterium]